MRPLLMAAWHGHIVAIRMLIGYGACVTVLNKVLNNNNIYIIIFKPMLDKKSIHLCFTIDQLSATFSSRWTYIKNSKIVHALYKKAIFILLWIRFDIFHVLKRTFKQAGWWARKLIFTAHFLNTQRVVTNNQKSKKKIGIHFHITPWFTVYSYIIG